MHAAVWSLVFLIAFGAMELMAWIAHRYLMHGWGWGWHRSHHEPRRGHFEVNDLYALVGTAAAIGLFLVAGHLQSPGLQAVAAGVTAYGMAYAFVHDGVVHQRWPLRWRPRGAYLRRLVQAHRLHHAVRTREGGVSFGFLLAPSPGRLAARLRAQRNIQNMKPRET